MQSIARRASCCAVTALFGVALASCTGGLGAGSSSNELPNAPAALSASAPTLRHRIGAPKVSIKEFVVPGTPSTGDGVMGGIVDTKYGVYLTENGYYNPTAALGQLYANGTFTPLISYDPNFQGPPTGAIGATANGDAYIADVAGPLYYDYPSNNAGYTAYPSGSTKGQYFQQVHLAGTISDMAGDTKGNLWYGVTPNVYGDHATVFSFSAQVVLNAATSIEAVGAGRNGDAWVAANDGNLYHISSAGTILHTYALSQGTNIRGIVVDAQGVVWFTDNGHNAVGRLSRTGMFSRYSIPTAGSDVDRITIGGDGALWFTESGADKIGRMSKPGHIHEYRIPTADAGPSGIASLGPGCNSNVIWFIEQNAQKLGEIMLN